MKQVEKHIIKPTHPAWRELDELAFKSKNLYNKANYLIRQSFIKENKYLNYYTIEKELKNHECYRALPAKVSQQVLKKLHLNWCSFFEALHTWRENPSLFTGKPSLPKYKDKLQGRNLLIYVFGQIIKTGKRKGKRESGAISKRAIKKGFIAPSQTTLKFFTKVKQEKLLEVRIIPKKGYYVVEVVYEKEIEPANLDEKWVAAIDLGVENLATVTSNQPGFTPLLVNGRPLKNINQYYNQRRALIQKSKRSQERKLVNLTMKRNVKVDDYLHKASRLIIKTLVAKGIGTLVIGQNLFWKLRCNLGKVNNQNFVNIPHARFISMLTYKAQLVGIKVILTEESYTSAASFLDGDLLPVYEPNNYQKYKFSGRRIRRGLYKSKEGKLVNADVNASYNILRKAIPNAFSDGIEAVVVQPVRITPAK